MPILFVELARLMEAQTLRGLTSALDGMAGFANAPLVGNNGRRQGVGPKTRVGSKERGGWGWGWFYKS